jgi:hypothetical protein
MLKFSLLKVILEVNKMNQRQRKRALREAQNKDKEARFRLKMLELARQGLEEKARINYERSRKIVPQPQYSWAGPLYAAATAAAITFVSLLPGCGGELTSLEQAVEGHAQNQPAGLVQPVQETKTEPKAAEQEKKDEPRYSDELKKAGTELLQVSRECHNMVRDLVEHLKTTKGENTTYMKIFEKDVNRKYLVTYFRNPDADFDIDIMITALNERNIPVWWICDSCADGVLFYNPLVELAKKRGKEIENREGAYFPDPKFRDMSTDKFKPREQGRLETTSYFVKIQKLYRKALNDVTEAINAELSGKPKPAQPDPVEQRYQKDMKQLEKEAEQMRRLGMSEDAVKSYEKATRGVIEADRELGKRMQDLAE